MDIRLLIVALCASCAAAHAHAETLGTVYGLALQNDPGLRAAQSAYLAGQESKIVARAALMPKLAAEANWVRSEVHTTAQSSNPFAAPGKTVFDSNAPGYTVSLTQSLINLPALYEYKRGAVLGKLAAYQFESDKQALALRVADEYLQTLTAGSKFEAAKSAEESLRQQFKSAKVKYDMGMTRITSYLEAQAALDAAVADTLVARNRLSVLFSALRVLTGTEIRELAALPDDFVARPPVPSAFQDWREAAATRNIDVQIARLRVDEARQLSLARGAAHWPTLSTTLSYTDGEDRRTYNTAIPDKLIRTGASVAVTLSVPLYSGGALSAAAREAGYRLQEQRDKSEGTERAVVQRAQSNYLNVIAGVAAVSARKAAIVSSQSALEFARRGFDEGLVDIATVLDAEKNVYLAKQHYADARYSYLIAGLGLKQVAGALGASDIGELDRQLDPAGIVRDPL